MISSSLSMALPTSVSESEHESNDDEHQESQMSHSYHYEYAVHDPVTGDEKKHQEVSDGHGTVKGTYSLVEPDGSTRVVEYTADDVHGFHAEIKKIAPAQRKSSSVYKYDLSEPKVQSFPMPVDETDEHLLTELLTSQ